MGRLLLILVLYAFLIYWCTGVLGIHALFCCRGIEDFNCLCYQPCIYFVDLEERKSL